MTELKIRGVADIFIACCDGLTGFLQAIETEYLRTQLLRKIIKTRGAFPTDEADSKLLYQALLNLSRRRTRPLAIWIAAINQFIDMYRDKASIT